jgi:hypothetical protein
MDLFLIALAGFGVYVTATSVAAGIYYRRERAQDLQELDALNAKLRQFKE